MAALQLETGAKVKKVLGYDITRGVAACLFIREWPGGCEAWIDCVSVGELQLVNPNRKSAYASVDEALKFMAHVQIDADYAPRNGA